MSTPCTPNVQKAGLGKDQADDLINRMFRAAQLRAEANGEALNKALQSIAGEIRSQHELEKQVAKRNALLTIQAKRRLKDYASRFKTLGEGVLSFLEGSSKVIPGSRFSVDGQSRALNMQYFGRLVAEMEQQGVLRRFKSGDNMRNVFIEMGELGKEGGKPGKTKDEEARKIASIVNKVTDELVSRQNAAGAYIQRAPGYIIRQTHDINAIRRLGGNGGNKQSQALSYKLWKEFTLPLLDIGKTTQGADVEKFMRNVHQGLYSGIHGPMHDEAEIRPVAVTSPVAKKVSESRVLWFKDAESAYKYNDAFGIKDFKEAVLSDIHHRTRNIALMENLGPNPESTLKMAMQEMSEEARGREDAAKQVDSLNRDWKIQASFNELSGRNEHPANVSLNRVMGNLRILAQLSKMGSVVLSSFADRAFLQAEATYQGIGNLQAFGKQIASLAPKTGDAKQTLRLMGVGLDGLMGNALSRYSSHTTVGGLLHEAQKKFFSLNFLNQWTDSAKMAAGDMFTAHLGEHSHLAWDKLPQELRNVLTLYDFNPLRWDAIRSTAVDHPELGGKLITPMDLKKIDRDFLVRINDEKNVNSTPDNIERARNELETALRTYITDRVDIAVPTPGTAERKWATMNTQAGTPLGEAVRMLMLFKSFPLTILNRVMGREIYGNGANTFKQWLMQDTKGKFHLAQLMAMGVIAGYTGGAIRDLLKGRNPKPLIKDDGSLNWQAINDATVRGGTLGTLGDILLNDYDRSYRGFMSQMAGPVMGQMDTLGDIKTKMQYAMLGTGKFPLQETSKFAMDNTPFLNLFYVRPVMDYLILWNLEEAMSPGSLKRQERAVENKANQSYWFAPSEHVK